MTTKNLIGIEIGGTKLQIVRGDENLVVRERMAFAVDREQGAAGIRSQIESSVARFRQHVKIDAVGIGFGGPVDRKNGLVLQSFQVAGWADFPICDWMSEISEAISLLENDSNLAALAESRYGAGKGLNPVFYTNIGTGVGGGLVVDGRIYHGKTTESEIGHVLMDATGTSLEDVCSGPAIDGKVRRQATLDPGGVLAGLSRGATTGEARFLPRGMELGDRSAAAILEEAAGSLAFALLNASRLLDPEIIVLGGGLSLIGEPWRHAVDKALRIFSGGKFRSPEVALSALGELVVPTGALILAAAN